MLVPVSVNLGASLGLGSFLIQNLTRSVARPRCCPPRAWTRGCAPDYRFLMVDTSWDRPGVDPESFFDAPEEQVASREQSPTTSSKIQSSEWENSELGKVMQSLSERPALVGRVRLLIACFDLGVLKRLSTLPVICASATACRVHRPRGCQPLAVKGAVTPMARRSGGSAALRGRAAAACPIQVKDWQNITSSSSGAESAGGNQWWGAASTYAQW